MIAKPLSASSIEQRAANLGIVEDVGQFEDLLGLLRREFGKRFGLPSIGLVEFGGSLRIHRLAAPDTQRLVSGCLPAAAGTLERGDRIRLVLGDVDVMDLRELTIGVLSEDRDVAGRDVGSADPAVMFLDVGLVQVPRSEERSAGLPEVRQRDGLVDIGPISGLVEDLRDHPIGDRLALGDLRPERGVGVLPVGMIVEPAVDVGDCRDQHDSPAALFPLDGDLESVVMVLDVADFEALELAATEASVKLQGDHGRVACVVTLVDHRDDLILPLEHLAGIRRGVVVVRGAGRDPVDGRRTLVVAVSDALREDAEGRPVVPVRLLVVVGAVDPGDDRLGGITVLEGNSERVVLEFLGHDNAVSEEFLVTEVAVGLGEEIEAVGKVEQEFAIGVADAVAGLDSITKIVDSVARFSPAHELLEISENDKTMAMNLGFPAPPWLAEENELVSVADGRRI